MRSHHIAVRRSARYYVIGGSEPVREVWLACHGYRQLGAAFARRLEPLRRPGRLVLVPEALNRFYLDDGPGRHGPESRVGATWMTRDDRLADIDDYVAYLDTLVEHATRERAGVERLVGLGFSQGVATIARWAVQGTGHPALRALVGWGSPLPPDLDLTAARERLHGVNVLLVAGDADRAFPAEEAAAEEQRLRAAGIATDVLRYVGGHRVERTALQAAADRLAPSVTD